MNQLAKLLGFLSLVICTLGCEENNGDGGSDEMVIGQAIAGTWFIRDTADVVVPQTAEGGVEKQVEAGDFVGFRLTITPGRDEVAYITQGMVSPVIFPPQGTLVVEASDDFIAGAEVIRQPDLVPMTIQLFEADTASLRVEFSVGADASIPANNGRTTGISGNYRFLMIKQQSQ